jgi:hypothetical protein
MCQSRAGGMDRFLHSAPEFRRVGRVRAVLRSGGCGGGVASAGVQEASRHHAYFLNGALRRICLQAGAGRGVKETTDATRTEPAPAPRSVRDPAAEHGPVASRRHGSLPSLRTRIPARRPGSGGASFRRLRRRCSQRWRARSVETPRLLPERSAAPDLPPGRCGARSEGDDRRHPYRTGPRAAIRTGPSRGTWASRELAA